MRVWYSAVIFTTMLTFIVAWPEDYLAKRDFLDRVPQHYFESGKSHKINSAFKIIVCIYNIIIHTEQQQSESFHLVYSLNMTLPNQSCPDTLKLRTFDSQRLCGKSFGFHPNSIAVPVNGQLYRQVRGKVTAYQYGKVDAFGPYSEGNCTVNVMVMLLTVHM
jgi:hypothetical protein